MKIEQENKYKKSFKDLEGQFEDSDKEIKNL